MAVHQFIEILSDSLSARGWSRKGTRYIRGSEQVRHEILVSKSRCADWFNCDLRVSLKKAGDNMFRVLDISSKSLHPDPALWAQITQSDGRGLSYADQVLRVEEMIDTQWTPFFARLGSEDQLRDVLKSLEPGVGPQYLVNPASWSHFNLPYWNGKSIVVPGDSYPTS